MRSDVYNGPFNVEVHGSGVFVKWYEKWTGSKPGPLLEVGYIDGASSKINRKLERTQITIVEHQAYEQAETKN
jgi:hypothetical protein